MPLGNFDVEENAARAYDAAQNAVECADRAPKPINFPGDAPPLGAGRAAPPLPRRCSRRRRCRRAADLRRRPRSRLRPRLRSHQRRARRRRPTSSAAGAIVEASPPRGVRASWRDVDPRLGSAARFSLATAEIGCRPAALHHGRVSPSGSCATTTMGRNGRRPSLSRRRRTSSAGVARQRQGRSAANAAVSVGLC